MCCNRTKVPPTLRYFLPGSQRRSETPRTRSRLGKAGIFYPLHHTHALSVPRFETRKNIFSLTVSDMTRLPPLSRHVIAPAHPMDTLLPSSSGPGGLLRQGCGLDVTRSPAGSWESLPPVTKRSNQARRTPWYDSACDLCEWCLQGIATGQWRTNAQ